MNEKNVSKTHTDTDAEAGTGAATLTTTNVASETLGDAPHRTGTEHSGRTRR